MPHIITYSNLDFGKQQSYLLYTLTVEFLINLQSIFVQHIFSSSDTVMPIQLQQGAQRAAQCWVTLLILLSVNKLVLLFIEELVAYRRRAYHHDRIPITQKRHE